MRVPQRKSAKIAVMTSSFGNFEIREKRTSKIFVRSFVENVTKIHSYVLADAIDFEISKSETLQISIHLWKISSKSIRSFGLQRFHTQTHRQTDTHAHTLGSIATYSVKITEYKRYFGMSYSPKQDVQKCLILLVIFSFCGSY